MGRNEKKKLMNNNLNNIWLCLFVCLILVLTGCKKKEPVIVSDPDYRVFVDTDIINVIRTKDQNIVALEYDDNAIKEKIRKASKEYKNSWHYGAQDILTREKFITYRSRIDIKTPGAIDDYFWLIIYDIGKDKLVNKREFDLHEAVRNIAPKAYISSFSRVFYIDGKKYSRVTLQPKIENTQLDVSYLYFNLETEELEDLSELEKTDPKAIKLLSAKAVKSVMLNGQTTTFLRDEIGSTKQAPISESSDFTFDVREDKSTIPDMTLVQRYPELKVMFEKDRRFSFVLNDELPMEEMMSLFVKEGEDPFADIILHAGKAVDNKEHTITSFDDLYHYFWRSEYNYEEWARQEEEKVKEKED